ncbi:pyridoxamine 5'-phosphate oxidase family protein [Rugamonas sp.]|uniref:pyridoxamine 5'-phosphate oxidase family protein n=1 Tax=Rugamonas sp. TaxID=1926287 RepID=UPI0025EADE3C|nr:pyridoxamine 5'-phosphate oxidase family protein [Rugamonas sp.]
MNKPNFHPGELAVQTRAKQDAIAARNGTLISDTVLVGARPFIAQQWMIVLSSVDDAGALWSSVLFGQPGFVHTSEDARRILVNVPVAERDLSDPLWANIPAHPDIGMLFLEFGTRRRYRVNGRVERLHDGGLEVVVREAYPVCPKYIRRRQVLAIGDVKLSRPLAVGTAIDTVLEGILQRADSLFVASHHAEAGADASNRGGTPGFVKVVNKQLLRIPDFHGNSMFNTMGNLLIDPRVGLCIPDFEQQQILQLSGQAVLHWDQNDPHNQTGGTGRFWEFTVERWLLRQSPQHVNWEHLDPSPFLPETTN